MTRWRVAASESSFVALSRTVSKDPTSGSCLADGAWFILSPVCVGVVVGGQVGGGAGTAAPGLTGNRDIEIPAESILDFMLADDLASFWVFAK